MSYKTSIEIENRIIDLLLKGLKVKEVSSITKVSRTVISRITLEKGLRQKGEYLHSVSKEETNHMIEMHLSGKSLT